MLFPAPSRLSSIQLAAASSTLGLESASEALRALLIGSRGAASTTGGYCGSSALLPQSKSGSTTPGGRHFASWSSTSLDYLLRRQVTGPVTTAAGRFATSSFSDWSLVGQHVAAVSNTEAGRSSEAANQSATLGGASGAPTRAYATLIRSGQQVVGFVSVVWASGAQTQQAAQALEDALNEDVCPALERALWRVQTQARATERERSHTLQVLQQRFLARMSHGAFFFSLFASP